MNTWQKRFTLFTVSLALFMDILDSNIINTSIPAISRSLQVNPIDLKIALLSYLLSLAIFIPTSGWAADNFGVKRIFLWAFVLFTISSFLCGFSKTLSELVIARSLQGMGGAFMISIGRLIIAHSFKRHEFVNAMNTVVIVVSVAVMLGPYIGGYITDHFTWPWIFWVNIPIGILAIILANVTIKDTHQRKPRPFDLKGFFLFGGSLSLLCFSLSELSETNVNLHMAFLLIVISITMLFGYVVHARSFKNPIINLKLFYIRTFRVSVSGNLFARLGFGGMPFLLPLLQQIGLGFSAEVSGLLLTPMAFGIVFSKILSLSVLRKVGYKKYLIFNTLIVATILLCFQLINTYTTITQIILMTFIFGIFLSAQFTAMNSLAYSDMNTQDLSAATSITSTVQVLAQSFGVAVGAILLRFFSHFQHDHALTPTVFHHTFLVMGCLTFLSTLIFLGLKPTDGRQMLTKEILPQPKDI